MKNRSSSGKMCEMTNPGKVYPTVKITKVEERRAVGIFSCGCKSGQEWPNLRVKLVSFPDFHQVSLCEREIEKFLLCRVFDRRCVAVLANIFIELILVSGIRC